MNIKFKYPIKNTFLCAFIGGFLLIPLFPNLLGAVQLHVTIGSFLFSLIYIYFNTKINFEISKYLITYYLCLFLLLFPSFMQSALYGQISILNLTSLMRPLFLCTIAIMFISVISDLKKIEKTIFSLFTFLAILTFIYSIFELFVPATNGLVEFLYKRDFLKKSASVSFYGQSYFSAFANFTIFIFIHAKFINARSNKTLLLLFCSMLTIVLSQSKAILFCLIVYWVIYGFLTLNKFLKALLVGLSVLIVTIFILNIDTVVYSLQLLELSSANSLSTVLKNPEESGSLTVRLAQIMFAIDSIRGNYYLFGAGTGASMYLESIYAEFLYRYGGVGLFLFFFGLVSLFFINMKSYNNLKGVDSLSSLGLVMAIWSALLPLSQFSSPMIEISKPSILSVFVFSLSFVLWGYSKKARIKR